MFASSWLRQLQRRWFPRRAIRRVPVRRVRPCLEVLEDRTAPAMLTVNSLSDSATPPSNVLTLREAIQAVDTGSTAGLPSSQINTTTNPLGTDDTIVFDPSLTANRPATLALGIVGDNTFGPSALLVSKAVSIIGPSGANGLTIARDTTAAPDRLRLFYVTNTGDLTLENLTLSGGLAQGGSSLSGGGGAGLGGAVVNAGSLTLLDDTVTGNQAIGGSAGVISSGDAGGGLGGNGSNQAGGPPNGSTGSSDAAGFGGGGALTMNGGFGGGGGGGFVNFGGNGFGGFGGGGGGGGGLGFHGRGGFGGGSGASSGYGTPGAEIGGGGAGMGGGIFNYGGSLTIINSTLAGNTAQGGSGGSSAQGGWGDSGGSDGSGLGGAVFNLNGKVVVTYSTLASNVASTTGGAIFNLGDDNIATQDGPRLPNTTAVISLFNSILAGSNNGSGSSVGDYVTYAGAPGAPIGAQSTSGNDNLFQTIPLIQSIPGNFTVTDIQIGDPLLSTLQNNGGPTATMAITSNSSAYQKGTPINGISTDQRGQPMDSPPDLGAYQLPSLTSTAIIVTPSSPNDTSAYGASVIFTAAVSNTSGIGGAPTGSVEFYDGSTDLGAGVAATSASNTSGWTFTTDTLSAGPHNIKAVYTPSGSFESNTGTLSQTVTQAQANISISGASVTYDGTAHAATGTAAGVESPNPANLTNLLSLYYSSDGGQNFSSSAPVNAGKYEIYYTFAGNTNYQAVTTKTDSGQAVDIAKATPIVPTPTVANNAVYNGQPQGATVSDIIGVNNTDLGVQPTLTYYAGRYSLATLPNSGGSSTAPTDAGIYTVVASFAGSNDYTKANDSVTFSIIPATPTVSVTDKGGTYNGNPFPASVTVVGVDGTTPVNGSFNYVYYIGSDTAGSRLGSTAPSAPGSYTVQAIFTSDDSNYTDGSAQTTFTINPASIRIAANNAATIFNAGGQKATLTANASSDAGTVNQGTVTFTVEQNGAPIGPAATSSTVNKGIASVVYALPAGLPAGSYTIDAAYNPGPDFSGSEDDSHTLLVTAAATTTTAGNVKTSFSTGAQDVTLTADVSSAAGLVGEGTVTFTVFQGGTAIGSSATSNTVHNGQASVVYVLPADTAAGTYRIDAVYNPGPDFSGSSGTASVVVNAVAAGGSASNGATWMQMSAGFFALAIEEFELTLDSELIFVAEAFHLSTAPLQGAIASLQTSINGAPMTPTFLGQLAILLGQTAARDVLTRV